MNNLSKQLDEILHELAFNEINIDDAEKSILTLFRDTCEEVLNSLGKDDNIDEWKNGVRLKIMKDFTK